MLAAGSWSTLFVGALLAAGCGARSEIEVGTSSASSDVALQFPVGTFRSCAQGVEGPSGNVFLNSAGVIAGAVLEITRDGSNVTATYTNTDGGTPGFTFAPLTFAPTTATSTTLKGGGSVGGLGGLCVQGPGDEGSFAASVTLKAGALTYDANTMFLSLDGVVHGGHGSACGESTQPEHLWITCGNDGAGSTTTSVAAPAPTFPAGTYSCSTGLGSYADVDGLMAFATSGDQGTLVVTQDGAKVTAAYTGDTSLTGTLDFTVTTSTTASGVAAGTLEAMCALPLSTSGPTETTDTLAVAASSLVVVDTTLFVSFRGQLDDGCASGLAVGTLVCTKE